MDSSHFEATEENQDLNFSDKEQTKDEMDFIDDSVQMREGVSFYRNVDLSNIDNYNKFPNQTRDPRSAVYEDNEMFFDVEDTQPELYAPENRETVKFDFSNGSEKSILAFKETLQTFEGENSFFNSIFYGLMHKKTEVKEKPLLEKAKDILGENLYDELSEIKEEIKLDRSVFRFFLTNQLLSKHGYFLKFFERRDKFHYLIKRVDARDKNQITRDLCSSVIEKFNGYQITKHELARKEQRELEPLCIVYDRSYFEDENAPVPCFFTDQIHLVLEVM